MIIDLTHPFGGSVYLPPGYPAVTIEPLASGPGTVLRDTVVNFVVHVGTHIDAPCHLRGRTQDIAQVPLRTLIGPAVAWRIDCREERPISASELMEAAPAPRHGDRVFLWTGWDRHAAHPQRYAAHPHLSAEAADWLVSRGVALVGIDTPTPDMPLHARRDDFGFPVHRRLLGNDIPIVENVANLAAVTGRRFRAYVCPVPFQGSDGAPARVLAELDPPTVTAPGE